MSFLTVAFPHGVQLEAYPALSVGIVIFTFALLVLDTALGGSLSNAVALYPSAPLKLDLNALSLYPLLHQNILHWLFNVISLWTPLCMFEKNHGTVYTGITLNLLAVSAALPYCLFGLFFYPDVRVIGLSGVVFAFITFFAYHEQHSRPTLARIPLQGRQIEIPTIAAPFIALVVCAVLIPGSSFVGHAVGIASGFLLAKGYLNILYPPSKIVKKIESTLDRVIVFLNTLVTFVKEEDAVELRNVSYSPLFAHDIEAGSTSAEAPPRFNETNILGSQ